MAKPSRTRQLTGWAILLALVLLAGRAVRSIVGKPSFENWPLALSALLWVLFSMYWSIAAKNSSRATRSETRGSRRVHEILLNVGLLLLFIPVPGMTQRFAPLSPIVTAAGLAVQIACGALGIWARKHLGAHWSGEITIKVDHQLIRTGPYRLIRHPIYTAMLGMFAGTAIVSGQTHALLGLALGVIAYWRKIRMEEENLNDAFGDAYHDYRRETWALVPGVF